MGNSFLSLSYTHHPLHCVLPSPILIIVTGTLQFASYICEFASFLVCVYVCVCVCVKSFQLCLTLRDPMDHSPPGSSVYGILQARILEWISMPSSRGSSDPGIELMSLCLLHWQAGSLLSVFCTSYFFILFWRRADLQCGISFRCTAK